MRTHNFATRSASPLARGWLSAQRLAPPFLLKTQKRQKKNNLRLNKSQLQPKNAPSQFKKYLFPLLP